MPKTTKTLDTICGNAAPFAYLSTLLQQSKDAPHAIMLSGPESLGKRFGIWQLLMQEHHTPALDSFAISPLEDKTSIAIDQIRDLQSRISRRPLSGHYWVVIDDVASMTEEAANGLLKVLEEPRTHTTFVLITNQIHRVPRTIISRCVAITFGLVPRGEIQSWLLGLDVTPPDSRTLSAAAAGCPGVAWRFIHQPEALAEWQEQGRALCELMHSPVHERLQVIQSLLPPKSATSALRPLLHQWIGIARDMLLLKYASRQITHLYMEPTLRDVARIVSRKKLIHLIDTVADALRTTGVPLQGRIVLENCALSL